MTVRRGDGEEISLKDLSMSEVLSQGETVRAEEIVLWVPDGPRVTALMNATPIRADDGSVETVVVTLQDLAPLEELERLRAEFLALVSHELRGPLTSIKGSAATLLESSADLDPAEMRQFFRIINDQADHMRDLIGDLLDVARIETGTLSLTPGPTAVAEFVDEAKSRFLSGGGRDTLELALPPDLPLVLADRRRIVQVLDNLLANAARHSPEPAPIRISAVREAVHVAVSVADRGRGIAAARLPHLFRKFSRTDAPEPGSGNGLGLAICKGIVEAHGGRIWAESGGAGLGTRVTFTLPVAAVAAPVPTAAAASGEPGDGEAVPILVVDDDPQALRYMRDTLGTAGFHPIVTGDPAEVLQLMQRERPQLALLDLMLPESDGIALMQQITEVDDLPVIFVSAYGQDQLIARAFAEGAADYVVKPFSPTELLARIGAALRRREHPEPFEPYVAGDLVIDWDARHVTLAGTPLRVTAIEYRLLAELAANAGRVVPYGHLLRRVWHVDRAGDVRPMRTVVNSLRRKLGDDADQPTYLFTEPRVGYRMAKPERLEPGAG